MRPRSLAWIMAATALVALLAWWQWRPGGGSGDDAPGALAAEEVPADAGPPPAPRPPEAAGYIDRLRFEERARSFPRRASRMGAVERSEEARWLEQQLAEREQRGEVSAGESMLLRAALIEATAADPAEQARRSAELVAHYREDAERRQAAWRKRLADDPQQRRYKAREQAVVAEVMAMREIPGGMDRDAYLRQRLQHEREAAWSSAPR